LSLHDHVRQAAAGDAHGFQRYSFRARYVHHRHGSQIDISCGCYLLDGRGIAHQDAIGDMALDGFGGGQQHLAILSPGDGRCAGA
jgi:hypothetical protein